MRLGPATRFSLSVAAAACAFIAGSKGEVSVPIPTEVGSGVTLKLSSPVASVPRFGFLPVRVSVENLTTQEGTWRFRFDAGNPRIFPGLASSTFEVTVPAARQRETWLYVPVAEPGISINPALLTAGSAGPGAPAITPPPIAGVYPDPKIPGVSYDYQMTTSPGGPAMARTVTITQIGAGSSLPEIPKHRLPAGALSTITRRASDGLVTRVTIIPLATGRAGPGGGASMTTPSPSMIAMSNARMELARGGLNSPGVRTTSSVSLGPIRSGLQEVTVTLRQTGPASSLPWPTGRSLPTGFTHVDVIPDSADPKMATREFTYVETVPLRPPAPLPVASVNIPATRPKTTSELQTEARRVLAPTKLLEARGVTKTSTSTQPINILPWPGMPGAGMAGHAVFLIEQTGPSSALSQPTRASLPPGVRGIVVPSPKPNEVTRVLSYVDPSVPAALAAAASAPGSATATPGINIARLELQRLGFWRAQSGVTQAAPVTRYSTAGVSGPHDLVIFTETGPAPLLPLPPAAGMPPGISCTVTPAPLAGEVARNFVANIPTLLSAASPAVPLPVRGSSAARVPTGTMLHPASLTLDVSGPGLRAGARVSFPNAISSTAMAPLALNSTLEQPVRGALAALGSRSGANVAPIDPAQLPADWRVWSSFNAVLLQAEEFASLDPARRAALRNWVATGGLLFLSPENAGPVTSERVGAGRIETLPEPVGTLGPAEIFSRLQLDGVGPAMPERERMTLMAGTPMGDIVSFENSDTLWVSLLLVVFALLIGPANVYYFASAKRRHRLFITTPLLSLAGAVAIAIAILLQDGLGGEGLRRTLVIFVPGDNHAAVFQEQATRTGFLLQRDFALDEQVVCSVLPADGNVFTTAFNGATFTRHANAATGDWFRNRSRQAHLLRALTPTRARVEVVGHASDGAPLVESTVSTELRDFRLRDEQGRIWSADTLPTGRRTTLQSESRFAAAASASLEAGGNGTSNLNDLLKEASTLTEAWQWVARGGAIDIAPIMTLRSIRWEDDPVLYAGVASRSGSLPKGGAE